MEANTLDDSFGRIYVANKTDDTQKIHDIQDV